MSATQWTVPPSVVDRLSQISHDRTVVLLLRHSVRNSLPAGDAAYTLPITEEGVRIAEELGNMLQGHLRRLHSSPLHRCLQTADALRIGAGADLPVHEDRLLGDPSIFVIDERLASDNWDRFGHERMVESLVSEDEWLPGMANADAADRFLVHYMLAVANNEPGAHIFITHDSLIGATVARMMGQRIETSDWLVLGGRVLLAG